MARRRSSEPSEQAKTAAAIRAALKVAYPTVKFRVTSDSFAGGNAVDVEWTDGPTTAQVEAIAGKHEQGHFDGMIDLYEYSNLRDDIPQAKYVQTRREISRAAYAAAIDLVNRRFGWSLVLHPEWVGVTNESDQHTGHGWRSQEINRLLHPLCLVCLFCGAATLPGDAYCPMCGASLAEKEEAA